MWAKVNLKADSELWASSLLHNTYVSLEKTTEKFWGFLKTYFEMQVTPPFTEAPTLKSNEEPIPPSGSLPSLRFIFICDPMLMSTYSQTRKINPRIPYHKPPLLVKAHRSRRRTQRQFQSMVWPTLG